MKAFSKYKLGGRFSQDNNLTGIFLLDFPDSKAEELNSCGHWLYYIWSRYPEETKTDQSYNNLKLQIVITISITICDKLYHYNVFYRYELIKTKAEPVGRMNEHPEACGQWDMGKLVRMLITKAFGPTAVSPL